MKEFLMDYFTGAHPAVEGGARHRFNGRHSLNFEQQLQYALCGQTCDPGKFVPRKLKFIDF